MKGKGWGRHSRGSRGHQSVLCSILINTEMNCYFKGLLYVPSAGMGV